MARFTQAEYESFLSRQAKHEKTEGPAAGEMVETEGDLHDQILEECRRRGWVAFHGSMAHKSHRTLGEPDFIVLCPRGQLLLIEAKSRTGKRSMPQLALAVLAETLGHKIYVVRSMTDFHNIAPV
jgi:Nuclease-related domain